MLVESILYLRGGEVQALSRQHRLDAFESQFIGSCHRNEFRVCLFGLFCLKAAENRAIVVLPKTLHVGKTCRAQPLHLIFDRWAVPVEI